MQSSAEETVIIREMSSRAVLSVQVLGIVLTKIIRWVVMIVCHGISFQLPRQSPETRGRSSARRRKVLPGPEWVPDE